MIEKVIEKLKEENLKLQTMLELADKEKEFNEVLNKLLNNKKISEEQLNEVVTYLNSNDKIDSLDKETIMFSLLVLIPNNEKLEPVQRKIIENLIKQYDGETYKEIFRQLTTNKTLIDKLSSNEIFIYLDDLDSTLLKYGFSKEKLNDFKKCFEAFCHTLKESNNIFLVRIEQYLIEMFFLKKKRIG